MSKLVSVSQSKTTEGGKETEYLGDGLDRDFDLQNND